MADPLTIAGLVGAGIAGFFGAKHGGKTGAGSTLNGTASAVKRIEEKVDTLGSALGEMRHEIGDVRERVAFIEGVVDRRKERR